jgi:lipopolysaccharide/colanic/teichoic acid biosynthesis glycosyltransferase
VNDALKRLFDLTVAGLGVLLLLPVFALIAIAIKATSAGPVFFCQTRVGRGERPFRIFKFRTMKTHTGPGRPSITIGNDCRITKVGALLRRFKLDELPQLFNVILGDMSVVGPRPETPDYVALYPPEERQEIFQVRPGITDNASIIFSNESDVLGSVTDPFAYYIDVILPRKRALYLDYVRNRSCIGDISIIWRTVLVILNGSGLRS